MMRVLCFLPEGMLDFLELVWRETESLMSRESQKDIAYTGYCK